MRMNLRNLNLPKFSHLSNEPNLVDSKMNSNFAILCGGITWFNGEVCLNSRQSIYKKTELSFGSRH